MTVNQAKHFASETIKQVHQGVANVFDAGAFITTTTDPLEKLAKITHRSMDFIQTLFKFTSKGMGAMSSRLKETVEVFEMVHVVERYKELCFPDANGQYFYQKNNWKKCADRTFLLAFSTLKTTWFFYSMGVVALGAAATVSLGSLAVFKLVTESLNVVSSLFGGWDSADKVVEMHSKSRQVKSKIEKWSNYVDYLDKVKVGDADEIAKLETKYATKTFLLKHESDAIGARLEKVTLYSHILGGGLDIVVSDELNKKLAKKSAEDLEKKFKEKAQVLAAKISTLEATRSVFESRLADIKEENFEALADKLSKIDANFKVKKWTVIKNNCTVNSTKSWLNILNKIFKVASISLAMVMIAMNYWAAPALLVLLGLGIISDGFNLSKHLYDHYVKIQPVPQTPPVVATVDPIVTPAAPVASATPAKKAEVEALETTASADLLEEVEWATSQTMVQVTA